MRIHFALLALMIALMLVPSALGHATHYSPDGKIKLVYGNLGEPVYTFQKTGLDLIISDNKTGAPITGIEAIAHGEAVPPKINVTLRYGAAGGQALDITTQISSQFGKPGGYTYPIIYTRPGLYTLHIKGNINGTMVDQDLAPAHEMSSLDTIAWPDPLDLPSEQATKIETLEARIAQLENTPKVNGTTGGSAPTIDAALLCVALLAVVAIFRRR